MFIFNYKKSILLGLFLTTLLAAFFASKITVYHDLETFFPQEDPDLDFYNEHQSRFQSDDNFIYIALENQPSIFDSTFLQKAHLLQQTCDTIENIIQTTSLTTANDILYSPFGLLPIPLLHLNEPEKYENDSTKIMQDERFVGRYISKDATVLGIMIFHADSLTEQQTRQITLDIDQILANFNFEKHHIAGRSHTIRSIVDNISNEFIYYLIIAVALTLIIMFLLLQKFWGVAISVIGVLLGLIIFMGILGATGKPLDIMSPLFPTLMIVVGMSDVIHVLSKYLDEINKKIPKEKALKNAIKEIGIATFLTSLTTAIGFASLYTANITAIKSFGIYSAVGVVITYIVVISFMASILLYFEPKQLANIDKHQQFWKKTMGAAYRFTYQYQKQIMAFSIALFFVCLFGISKITTKTYMLDDVPKTDILHEDFLFFEQKMSGVRMFELAIEAQNDYKVTDIAALKQMAKIDSFMQKIDAIGTLYSPITFFKTMHKANNGGDMKFYVLTENEKKLKKYEKQLNKLNKNKELNTIISEDKHFARMNASMIDVGSEKMELLNEKIEHFIADNIDENVIKVKLTGTASIVDKNHYYLRSSLFSGLAVAFAAVSIIMALLFRSTTMVLISLIANIFPLLIAAAVMGFVGIPLKASTSIIFTVAFGIAVDDTIHFLSKFKLQLNKGNTIDEAIYVTYIETGKAICLTTICLLSGFLPLVTSDFAASFYIGLLVSITLIAALVADFFLLPVCLKWFFKNDKI